MTERQNGLSGCDIGLELQAMGHLSMGYFGLFIPGYQGWAGKRGRAHHCAKMGQGRARAGQGARSWAGSSCCGAGLVLELLEQFIELLQKKQKLESPVEIENQMHFLEQATALPRGTYALRHHDFEK